MKLRRRGDEVWVLVRGEIGIALGDGTGVEEAACVGTEMVEKARKGCLGSGYGIVQGVEEMVCVEIEMECLLDRTLPE